MSDPSVVTPDVTPRTATTPNSFSCTRADGGGTAAWLRFTGELDLAVAHRVAALLRDAQAASHLVVADLRDLEFIDCAGLGVLVAAENEARSRSRSRSFVVMRGTGQVDRMMVASGLLEWLEVIDPRVQEMPRVPQEI